MKPLDFPMSNQKFGEGQDEYETLPVFKDGNGRVVSYWKLSWIEKLKILCFGKLWLLQLTFNRPFQPQLPAVDCPFISAYQEVEVDDSPPPPPPSPPPRK